MKPGDFVRITLNDYIKDPDEPPQVITGTLLHVRLETPLVLASIEPGPVHEVKVLTVEGEIWESWIDQRDSAEVLFD